MIRVEALGGLRILVGDQEFAALAKQRLKCGLLVFLAVERSVMRESLIATFWPDKEPDKARHALSQNLYELKKMLGEEWLLVSGDRLTIADTVRCDAVEFVASVENGELHAAMQAFGGEFLEGCYLAETRQFEEWIDRRQDRIHKLLRRALREASQLEERPEWIELAIDVARHAIERDSTDDDAQHALLQLLVRAGRRSEALKQYERYEVALAADGLEPLEHTKQLIAVAREAQEPVESPRVFPLPEPQRVFPAPEQTFHWPDDPVMVPHPFHRRFSRRGALFAVGLALAAVAATLPWWIGPPNIVASNPGVAVLYFSDNSRTKDSDYLASAFTEGLIDALINVPGLEVRSKSAVAFSRNPNPRRDSLIAGLEVTYLVDGSVIRAGNELGVSVQLSDATSRRLLHTAQLRRRWDESLEMQDTLVQEVAAQLRQALGRQFEISKRKEETRNRQALDHYWRARQIFDDFRSFLLANGAAEAEKSLARADSLLVLAERLDRKWNAPIVLRARVASMGSQVAMLRRGPKQSEEMRNALDIALQHANRAVENDSHDPEAYELRGWLHLNRVFVGTSRSVQERDRILSDGEVDLLRALDLDSTRVEASSLLSQVYLDKGQFLEALQTARNAFEADRYHNATHDVLYRLAIASFELGRDSAAWQWCEEGRKRKPDMASFKYCRLALLGWSTAIKPDVDAAWAEITSFRSDQPHDSASLPLLTLMAASVIARAGHPDSARHVIQSVRRTAPGNPTLLWPEAAALARVGDRKAAIQLLEHFSKIASPSAKRILNTRALEPLRSDSAFIRLLQSYSSKGE
jgi:DNA-binding SARP family transcriptional activator/TolB-like protein